MALSLKMPTNLILILLLLPITCMSTATETTQRFTIEEEKSDGEHIGKLGENLDVGFGPPYQIIEDPNARINGYINVDTATGIITTASVLDRERTPEFHFNALSLTTGNIIEASVELIDVNDNDPRFNVSQNVVLSEKANVSTLVHIGSAIDDDVGVNGISSYLILSGNEDGTFELKGRLLKPFLYLDISLNKKVDYETIKSYSLTIGVVDGGAPPRTGSTVIKISVLDANDNSPDFDFSRYQAEVREDASLDQSVLTVSATDKDSPENAFIIYTIDYRSDKERDFRVDPVTGVIYVNKPLDFENTPTYQLSVIASDNTSEPLRDSATVEITILDVNEQPANVNLLYLVNETLAGHIPENSQIGTPVARISVSDPDNPSVYYTNITVTLQGGDTFFGLETKDYVTYILFVKSNIDRETHPSFDLTILAVDAGTPPLQAAKSFTLWIDDVNDHTPQFSQNIYEATVQEQAQEGTSVIQVLANDQDSGLNRLITYGIQSNFNNSNWFDIDPMLGLVKVRARDTIDCEQNPNPWIIITATDSGNPPLTGYATLKIRVLDVNDMQPQFAHTYYEQMVPENIQVGSCILTVSADDPDCNGNTQLQYLLSNSTDKFSLGATSGKLCVEDSLDYETTQSYILDAFAVDSGGLRGDSVIRIFVTDVNDNNPEFYPRNYSQNLDFSEADSPGKDIVTVVASDRDSGINGKVFYRIVTGSQGGAFTIDAQTGLISLSAKLPMEERVYIIEVEAYDGGGLTSSRSATVYISVTGNNYPRPSFERATYSFTVPENTVKDQSIGQVSATVTNTGSNAPAIHYSITSGDVNGYFYIDRISGIIYTQRPDLDHEQKSSFLLSVTAETAETGSPAVFGKTQVNISVTDVNDNAPQFQTTNVEIHVWEDEGMVEILYKVIATDSDSGINGTVEYSLTENRDSTFRIGKDNGEIRLQKSLDYENIKNYTLVINAHDLGVPDRQSTEMTLLVFVMNRNDNPPVFVKTLYETNVAENEPTMATFLTVVANDSDMDQITYTLRDVSDVFGIWPNNGHMYLKTGLDREVQDFYQLYVIAKDNGKPSQLSATATVRILVTDANDNSPEFGNSMYIFAIPEDIPSRSAVGTVTATDQDINDNSRMEYSFDVPQNHFIINKYTGEISTSVGLDRETKHEYSMVVNVRDFGDPSRTDVTTVKIVLLDINDNVPQFTSGNTGTVEENKAKGTHVLRVVADDPDAGENGTVSYFFDEDATDAVSLANFDLDPKSQWITTAEVLDYEKQTEYQLVVIARDYGTPQKSSSMTITVKVIDDMQEEQITASLNMSIDVVENTVVGSIVGQVRLYPTDNSKVSYFIFAGNNFDLFSVNKTNGNIYCIRDIDYEVSSWHTFGVHAIDESFIFPQTSTIMISVNVLDVNDNPPKFEKNPVILEKPENQPVGQIVYVFSASDRDSGINGSVTYTLERQEPNSGFFELDAVTGELRIKSMIDYEQVKSITLVVRAEDGSPAISKRLYSSVVAKISILDQNDNTPEFKSYPVLNVSENVPVGYSLVKLSASDRDDNVNNSGNGVISYKIIAGNNGTKFIVDLQTGMLSVSHPLDRENQDKYSLIITATDHGMPQRAAYLTLTVLVDDFNDNPPLFNKDLFTTEVSENNSPGSYLFGVTATDADLGDNKNIRYVIPPGTAGGKFSINETTGAITVNTMLDREQQSSYEFTVFALDGGKPMLFDTARVIVNVKDENDNSPVFQQSVKELQIPENVDLAAFYTVKAQDVDEGQNGEITYSIVDGNSAGHFSIDSSSGELSCAHLDRETISSYNLTVMASDNGSATRSTVMKIQISVLDENDNAPTFIQEKYVKHISEDVQIGTVVQLVSASDRDEKINGNGRITYSLGNDTDGMFKVDSVNGSITTTRHFDREKKSVYTFQVVAEDNGLYNRKSATTVVEVTIDNVNDNSPIFQNVPYNVVLSESEQSGHPVVQATATDLDGDQLNYSLSTLSGENSLRYFQINSNTGNIVTRPFTSEAAGYHFLHVIAADLGSPPRTTTTVVQIRVGSSVQPHVQFTNQTYYASVDENLSSDTMVTMVTAQVVDGSTPGSIQYAIMEGNDDNTFSISSSGVITVDNNEKLDYETNRKLQLIVTATSGSLKGYTMVEISIQDLNDNSPVFAQNPYYNSVREDVTIGTTVSQVLATDLDSSINGAITYNILQPDNQDKVFVIDNNGHITTHLPLDFEIVRLYHLEIEAVDSGHRPKTGTCTVVINVVDINDQNPKFPPPNAENITETTPVGSTIMQVTANDRDLFPPLLYDFDVDGNQDGRFAINKFTGEIILAEPLDHEGRNHYNVALKVTDGLKTVWTTRSVYVMDVNDNSPVFSKASYEATVREMTAAGTAVTSVSATDRDGGSNGEIIYSSETDTDVGFAVNPSTGVVVTTRNVQYNQSHQTIQLVVIARDKGQPYVQSAVTFIHLHIEPVNHNAPYFSSTSSTINVLENSVIGSSVAHLVATDNDAYQTINYFIRSGNYEDAFYISHMTGELFVNGVLDRETKAAYDLDIVAKDNIDPVMSGSIMLKVTLDDRNDQAPHFSQKEYKVPLEETYPPLNSFFQVQASDGDLGNNSKVVYDIISGNEDSLFQIDSSSGEIRIAASKSLDYEQQTSHRLVIQATDCFGCPPEVTRLSGMTVVIIEVIDVNDHAPAFPVPFYYTVFYENQPVNSQVFQANAKDGDSGINGRLSYAISDNSFFKINQTSGWVYSNIVFDVEYLPSNSEGVTGSFTFVITASDRDGRNDTVGARVVIGDIDEHPPIFSEPNYDFSVPGNAEVGTIVGKVVANDNDGGSAGNLYYFLNRHNDYFDVNITSGDIYVKLDFNSNAVSRKRRDSDHSRSKRALQESDTTLIIEVRSPVPGSRSENTVVTIAVDQTCEGCQIRPAPQTEDSGLGGTTVILVVVFSVILVILIVVLVLVCVICKRNKKQPVAQVFDTDLNAFDFTATAPPTRIPQYNDVPNYTRTNSNNINSDISEHSHHSVSSGRGSVEAEDDEEICMINALQSDLNQSSGFRSKNMPDSGIQDDDNTSEKSAQNSKDYLARLGIDSTHIPVKAKNPSFSETSLPSFSEDGGGLDMVDNPLDIDYSKLGPVEKEPTISVISGPTHNHPRDLGFHEPEQYINPGITSSVINSEEEYSGSYNWDYLLDWGPQYQPLAHVFSEIARLKDDSVQPKKRPIQTVPQSSNVNITLKPQVKMIPPPIITNAPPQAVVQPANRRSSQSSAGSGSYMTPPRTLANSNSVKNNVSLPSNARSPITHEGGFTTPLTPSFTPSLLPLATGAPVAGAPNHNGHSMPNRLQMGGNSGGQHLVMAAPQECDQELRI